MIKMYNNIPTNIRISLFVAFVCVFIPNSVKSTDLWQKNLPKPIMDSDYRPVSATRAKLGQLLFYDPILSGNQNISCGTCHHHNHATSDGLSLPVGEGGKGLGPERTVGANETLIKFRVPRNSQSLFNLGAYEFTALFNDGRVELNPEKVHGIDTPADDDLPPGLSNILAAQAMFPVISETEMLGDGDENELASAFRYEVEDVWPLLAKRIARVPEYQKLFKETYLDVTTANDITMVHIANALSDFIAFEWRSHDSPFDSYLNGNTNALNEIETKGMQLFYGEAGCHGCHSGKFQTDHNFHAIAMPQLGLIRTRRFDPVVRDMGRVNQSDKLEDSYKFRTPSLRNIAQTAPYGHSGAFATLEAVVWHHLNPRESFLNYDRSQAILPHHPRLSNLDFLVLQNDREINRLLDANELPPMKLGSSEVEALIAFLKTLSDEKSLRGNLGIPEKVPSGLPVDR